MQRIGSTAVACQLLLFNRNISHSASQAQKVQKAAFLVLKFQIIKLGLTIQAHIDLNKNPGHVCFYMKIIKM